MRKTNKLYLCVGNRLGETTVGVGFTELCCEVRSCGICVVSYTWLNKILENTDLPKSISS